MLTKPVTLKAIGAQGSGKTTLLNELNLLLSHKYNTLLKADDDVIIVSPKTTTKGKLHAI